MVKANCLGFIDWCITMLYYICIFTIITLYDCNYVKGTPATLEKCQFFNQNYQWLNNIIYH